MRMHARWWCGGALGALVVGCGGGSSVAPPRADANAGPCTAGVGGLHVTVDLSGTGCVGISPDGANWAIDVTLDGRTLGKTDAASITDTGTPRHLDYWFAWPAGTTDGFHGTVTWNGNGNGVVGSGATTYTVDVNACVTATLVATCNVGVDAGV